MTSALASILVALLLSVSSLLMVFARVSPLTAPEFALPFFFASVLIAVSAATALLLSLAESLFHRSGEGGHSFLSRAVLKSSVRQGIFAGIATCVVVLLFLLRVLNWWIALLVYTVFVLIEMAVGR